MWLNYKRIGWYQGCAQSKLDHNKLSHSPMPSFINTLNWNLLIGLMRGNGLNKSIIRYKKEGRDCYCMPSGLEKVLSLRDCTKYFNIVRDMNWDTFDDYVNHIGAINYVEFCKKYWLKSKCSCSFWAKNYFCHHEQGQNILSWCSHAYRHCSNKTKRSAIKTNGALIKQAKILSSSDSSSKSPNNSDPSPIKKVLLKKNKQTNVNPKKIKKRKKK